MNSQPLKDLSKLSSKGLLEQSREIIESMATSWNRNKSYQFRYDDQTITTQIYTKDHLNDDYWAGRITTWSDGFSKEFKQGLFSRFMKYGVGLLESLEESHTEYEKEYIDIFYGSKLKPFELEETDPSYTSISYLAECYYDLGFPLKKRVFYELIHVLKSVDGSEAYVISLAVDPSHLTDSKSSFVHAVYTSIEKFTYQNEELSWKMCTCSDPGGLVPSYITKLSIKNAISKDVPSFLNWSRTKSV